MRTIVFVSPLGGTGQTTLLANIANLLARRKLPCLAVDLCPQNGLGLHFGLSQPAETGWAPLADADQWWGDAALENSAHVRFLPFGDPARASLSVLERLSQTFAQDAHWLTKQVQALHLEEPGFVLLDVPAWPCPLAQQALRCADVVVVTLDASMRASQARGQVQAMLSQAGPRVVDGVVVTRFDPRRDSQRAALRTLQMQWADKLAPYVLHDDENIQAASADASCVVDYAPQSQSAHDLQGIAAWLLAQCQPTA